MEQQHAAQLIRSVQEGDVATVRRLLCHDPASTVTLARLPHTLQASLVRIAIQADQAEALDVLLSLGCPVQHSGDDTDGQDEHEEDIDSESNSSPLCLAVEIGRRDCVSVLLAYGASIDATCDEDGLLYTPIHLAAMYDVTRDQIHDVLLVSTCHIDAVDMCENTPLHLAAAYGSVAVASALVAAGADVNACNASGSTPLHLASPNGYDTLVELLLRNGANVDAKDALGHTPLVDAAFVSQSLMNHFACGNAASQNKVIKLLLEYGANVNARNRDGDPVVFGAVRNGYTDAVLSLLDSGACVAMPSKRLEAVLHVAARAGVETIEIWTRLLLAGACASARDRYERTCLDIWISRPKMVQAEDGQDDHTSDHNEQPEENGADHDTTESPPCKGDERDTITCLLEAAMRQPQNQLEVL